MNPTHLCTGADTVGHPPGMVEHYEGKCCSRIRPSRPGSSVDHRRPAWRVCRHRRYRESPRMHISVLYNTFLGKILGLREKMLDSFNCFLSLCEIKFFSLIIV